MNRPRTIVNPVNKEVVTFIKTGEETNGEYMLIHLELATGGGVPMHIHTTYDERIKVVEGTLSISQNGENKIMQAGDEVFFKKHEPHRFWSESPEKVIFEMETRPARTFEEAIRIGDGLAADGKANKQGLPANILHMAVVWHLIESYLTAVPVGVQKAVFAPFYLLAKVSGVEKKLRKKYL